MALQLQFGFGCTSCIAAAAKVVLLEEDPRGGRQRSSCWHHRWQRTASSSDHLDSLRSEVSNAAGACAANVALLGEDLRGWPPEKRLLALSLAVHCADLGNPGKRLALSLNWSARISKEFFAQGDAERAAGLPISQLCDRTSADVAASQVS